MSSVKPDAPSTRALGPLEHTRTDAVGLPVWEIGGITISLGTVDRGPARMQTGVQVAQTHALAVADVLDVCAALYAASLAAREEQAREDARDAHAIEVEATAKSFSEGELLEAIAHAEQVGLTCEDVAFLREALEARPRLVPVGAS